MENVYLSSKEMVNLEKIFNENYLMVKRIRDFEKDIYDDKVLALLKKLRDIHEKNLLIIMKLLDEKERFI